MTLIPDIPDLSPGRTGLVNNRIFLLLHKYTAKTTTDLFEFIYFLLIYKIVIIHVNMSFLSNIKCMINYLYNLYHIIFTLCSLQLYLLYYVYEICILSFSYSM